jgi:predicted kinase
MMIACANSADGGPPLILLGLSDENERMMQLGRPLRVDLTRHGVGLKLAVVRGRDEAALEAVLRATGKVGPETRVNVDPRLDQFLEAKKRHAKRLILTVGLPRAGKSSWARTQPYPVVNPDAIRLAVHGRRFYLPAEQLVWYTAEVMVRALFAAGHDDVVLDATNVTRARRDRWRGKEWGVFLKTFDTSKEECLRRAADDEEIRPVIEKMAADYQAPEPDEEVWP